MTRKYLSKWAFAEDFDEREVLYGHRATCSSWLRRFGCCRLLFGDLLQVRYNERCLYLLLKKSQFQLQFTKLVKWYLPEPESPVPLLVWSVLESVMIDGWKKEKVVKGHKNQNYGFWLLLEAKKKLLLRKRETKLSGRIRTSQNLAE